MHSPRTWIACASLLTLCACASALNQHSPSQSEPSAVSRDRSSTIALGEIVSQLDPAIWRVHHAKSGDYWFGSRERGLYRYDGKTLTNFTAKHGMHYDPVTRIQEDSAGNLYFPTSTNSASGKAQQGITRFDGKTFQALIVPEVAAPATEWKLQAGDLWFGGGGDTGSVLRYDGKVVQRLALPMTQQGVDFELAHLRSDYPNINFRPNDPYILFQDSRGHLWVGTALLGACRFDGESFAWIPEAELGNGSFGTRSIVEDKDGKLWFCNSLHRYAMSSDGHSAASFQREAGLASSKDPTQAQVAGIMSSVLGPDGALWMATYADGVVRYDGKALTRYPVQADGKQIHIFSISLDRRGVAWLGTQANGVYRFNGKEFEAFQP